MSSNQNQPRLRYQRVQIEQIYYKEHLRDEFKSSRYPLPEDLKKARNMAIVLMWIELACCFMSFGFYIKRRSRVILFLIVCNFLATLLGVHAKLRLSYCALVAHAMYTISFIGGFYIYIMIDFAITEDGADLSQHDDHRYQPINETIILIGTSIPLLALFLMGIYSIVLASKVEDELEARESKEEQRRVGGGAPKSAPPPLANAPVEVANIQVSAPDQPRDPEHGGRQQTPLNNQNHVIEILQIDEGLDEDTCVICMDAKKETVFYPCGHQCLCQPCSETFKQEARHYVCPICRNRIKDTIKVFK